MLRSSLRSLPRTSAARRKPSSPISQLLSYSTTTSSSPNPNEKPPQHLLRNGLIATGLLAAAGVSYRYPEMFGLNDGGEGRGGGAIARTAEDEDAGKTFTTRIKTSRGIVQHEHSLLPLSASESLLHSNEISKTFIPKTPTSVIRYDTNWVASNDPIEDRHAEDMVERRLLEQAEEGNSGTEMKGQEKQQAGGIKLFSIMDGHSGFATSQLLSKTLHPMIVLSLRSLYAGNIPETPHSSDEKSISGLRSFISRIYNSLPSNPLSSNSSTSSNKAIINPSTISSSLISAFLTLDNQITTSPLRLLPHLPLGQQGKPNIRPIILPTLEPALSGSCAITLMVDEGHPSPTSDSDSSTAQLSSGNNGQAQAQAQPQEAGIWVASTGDCRAVAGVWVEGDEKSGRKSGWKCEVLTEDQMGDNPNEVKRMQKEHPASEKDTVIMHGRVYGGLQPTRAFGDSRYKWTREEHEAINTLLPADHENNRRPNKYHKTPPYVTARPEVSYRRLSKGADEEQVKFVIVATDGLWDSLSSEEAVALVASHMEAPHHAPVPATQINSALLPQSPSSASRYPSASESPGGALRTNERWVYEDDNAATHLIRNSLVGNTARKSVRELLSLKPPVSRWLRDDVTCTVVFFGSEGSQPGNAAGQASSPQAELPPVKARL